MGIFRFSNGTRIVFRISGTSSSGATVRIYFEKHEDSNSNLEDDMLNQIRTGEFNLEQLAFKLSKINEVTGRTGPSVIT
jgi:phosphoglucomutase